MRALTKALAILLPLAMLWGCSTTPKTTDADAAMGADTGAETMTSDVETGAIGMGGMDSGVEVGGVEGAGGFVGDPLQDPDSLLSKRTVYFDFDKSDIRPEAREIIGAHAKYLSEHPSVRIVLEGHADERGTREYNLGLGERRAKSAQQIMTLLGASSSQLEVVSYGEERPAAMGHDEDAWALNRRVEIVY
jgi:peptidoglycan-associated lipoprotein